MPEPVDNPDTASPGESVPTQKSRKLKWWRNWLIHVLVIFVVSSAWEKVYEHVSKDSIKHVRDANESFVKGVEAVNPFNLWNIFSGYLNTGKLPAPLEKPKIKADESLRTLPKSPELSAPSAPLVWRKFNSNDPFDPARTLTIPSRTPAVSEPPEPSAPTIWVKLLRIIPGAYYTAKTIISQGWISSITAAIALFVMGCFAKAKPIMLLHPGMIIPMMGCGFVWLLLKLMLIASWLFGELLAGIEMIVYFSTVVPAVGHGIFHAMAKEREHRSTEIISKGLADKLAK